MDDIAYVICEYIYIIVVTCASESVLEICPPTLQVSDTIIKYVCLSGYIRGSSQEQEINKYED